MEYFGQDFDPALCNKTCDNCKSSIGWEEKDVTVYVPPTRSRPVRP